MKSGPSLCCPEKIREKSGLVSALLTRQIIRYTIIGIPFSLLERTNRLKTSIAAYAGIPKRVQGAPKVVSRIYLGIALPQTMVDNLNKFH